MRQVSALALVAAAAVACGDGDAVSRCEPIPPAAPTGGPLADPRAIELPAACDEGGLRDLPGRWFVVDPARSFSFEYPKFEGSCETGFRRANFFADDHDDSDGFTFHTWSDGTRYYQRQYARFERDGMPPFETASVLAACMLRSDTVAAVRIAFDTDRGVSMPVNMAGSRFAPRDGAPVGLARVGGLDRRPDGSAIGALNVAIDGTHAYVVGRGGIDVIDIADPAAPVHRGHLAAELNDIKLVRGGGKLVAFASPSRAEDTRIVDVTDPTAPVLAAPITEYSHSVQTQIRGDTALLFLATYTNDIPVYDVTAPLAPQRLGAATVPEPMAGVHDLTVDGDRIYANNTTAGMVALDTAAGFAAAVELGRIETSFSHAGAVGTAGGRAIVLHGDEGMTATDDGGAFLRVIDADAASPTFLREIGRYQSRREVGIHNFELVGDKVYIAYYHDGVRVVSLADPTRPVEVAHYNTWDPDTAPGGAFEAALGIRVVDGLIYVADSLKGLIILREI